MKKNDGAEYIPLRDTSPETSEQWDRLVRFSESSYLWMNICKSSALRQSLCLIFNGICNDSNRHRQSFYSYTSKIQIWFNLGVIINPSSVGVRYG